MERIGYDSDNGCYYFRDRDGVVWQGAEGAEFSEMTRGEMSAGFTHTFIHPHYTIVNSFQWGFANPGRSSVRRP